MRGNKNKPQKKKKAEGKHENTRCDSNLKAYWLSRMQMEAMVAAKSTRRAGESSERTMAPGPRLWHSSSTVSS
jgi:hypothetical protein